MEFKMPSANFNLPVSIPFTFSRTDPTMTTMDFSSLNTDVQVANGLINYITDDGANEVINITGDQYYITGHVSVNGKVSGVPMGMSNVTFDENYNMSLTPVNPSDF